MPPLRQILAELGFKVDTKPLEQAKSGLGRIAGAWKAFAGVVAAGAAARGLVTFLDDAARAGDATARLGESLDLSARQVAEWQDAITRAGGDANQFGDSYKTFAKLVEDARKGGEDQIKSLRRMGVVLRDNRGRLRETSDLYEDAVVGLGKISSSSRRAAEAERAFGGAGLTMIRVGLAGRDALDAQRAAFDRLYGGNYERYIQRSREQVAASVELDASFTALKRGIAQALMPALTWLTTTARKVVDWFTRMSQNTKIFETTLVVLGAVAAGVGVALTAAFAGPIAVVAAIAAAIVAVILVVEDLWQLFTGGKSAIGGALDAMFGIGTAKSVVESVTSAVETLWRWTKMVGEAFVSTGKFLVGFGDALGDVIFDVVQAIDGAIQSVTSFFAELWQGLSNAWTTVVSAIESGVQRVLALVDRMIGPVRELYEGASSLLGLGDDDEAPSPRTVTAGAIPGVVRNVQARFAPRELPVGATGARPTVSAPARGGSQVRVEQPVNVTVSGAADPGAVGDAVRRAIEDHSRSGLEFARDLFLGIPGTTSS